MTYHITRFDLQQQLGKSKNRKAPASSFNIVCCSVGVESCIQIPAQKTTFQCLQKKFGVAV